MAALVNPPDYRHDTVLPLPMEVPAEAIAVDAACSGNPGPMEYNRTNRGIQYEKQPHYFLYLERGKYQYKGKNYIYNGLIETDPKY